jgi:hypothetical protein
MWIAKRRIRSASWRCKYHPNSVQTQQAKVAPDEAFALCFSGESCLGYRFWCRRLACLAALRKPTQRRIRVVCRGDLNSYQSP